MANLNETIAECTALIRDGVRYRELRGSPLFRIEYLTDKGPHVLKNDYLDAAVDMAIETAAERTSLER